LAKAYQYHRIEEFPILPETGSVWESTHQKAIPESGGDDKAYSLVRFLGESEHSDFYKYFAKHETPKNGKFRFANDVTSKIYVIQEFHLFIPRNLSYFFADTKTTYCKGLIKRLKESHPKFKSIDREIDLFRLGETINCEVVGGWFKKLQIADVSTAAIFGPTVDESEDWKRYANSGKLSALNINFPINGVMHSIQITHSGSIVLLQNYSEIDSLGILEKINDTLMKFANEIEEK